MEKPNFHKELFELKDENYKIFHKKLIPNINEDTIIGVRVPKLRALAKKLFKDDKKKCLNFMNELPHKYFEENNLHAFFIEEIKDINEAISSTEKLLPYINNWATCDLFSPKLFRKHPETILKYVKKWIESDDTYTVRYAIGILLSNFLDEHFEVAHLEKVASIKSEEYYINMMIAWYFSTALVKQYEATLHFIKERKLEKWTHNKAIQKAKESNRISEETKKYLNTLKIK